jgi:hypothetical protein
VFLWQIIFAFGLFGLGFNITITPKDHLGPHLSWGDQFDWQLNRVHAQWPAGNHENYNQNKSTAPAQRLPKNHSNKQQHHTKHADLSGGMQTRVDIRQSSKTKRIEFQALEQREIIVKFNEG